MLILMLRVNETKLKFMFTAATILFYILGAAEFVILIEIY